MPIPRGAANLYPITGEKTKQGIRQRTQVLQ
jgi:hypothetical protein